MTPAKGQEPSLEHELDAAAGQAVDFTDIRQRLTWVLVGLRHQRAGESDLIYGAYYEACRSAGRTDVTGQEGEDAAQQLQRHDERKDQDEHGLRLRQRHPHQFDGREQDRARAEGEEADGQAARQRSQHDPHHRGSRVPPSRRMRALHS